MTEPPEARLDAAAQRAHAIGLRAVESFAWRDLDDPDAGGSEVHADEIFRRWASHGIGVEHRTSTADEARTFDRNGYRVIQRGGRYDVFPRVIARQVTRRRPDDVATIEIWNGVPWLSPIWAPRRSVVWLHHVHREMWDDALPRPLNHAGRLVETRLAPVAYRRTQFATLSQSSAEEIEEIGIDPSRIEVIPPGVDERFVTDESRRSRQPHVVVVGRLAPVKRQQMALEALRAAREHVRDLTVEVVGEGPDRDRIVRWIGDNDAGEWVHLAGRITDDELVAAYQRAWVVLSASYAEGWGMSLTEAGACGTPCVATDIAGHRGAAVDGVTGRLVAPDRLSEAVVELLTDHDRRRRLGLGARSHSAELSWSAVASRHLDLLVDRVAAQRSERQRVR